MHIAHRAALGATAALAVLVPTGFAYAATTSSSTTPPTPQATSTSKSGEVWQKVDTKLLAALQARTQTLSKLTTSVNGDKTMSPQDRSTLDGLLANESQGIAQLLAQVQAATPQNTTVAQLGADAKTMVDHYRVYAVMARQVHLTESADAQTAVETKIESREAKIDAAIKKAGSPPNAVQAYNDLVTQVTNAVAATGHANMPAVLAVTPQGYPGDGGALSSARTALSQARTDLKAARGDLVTIRNVVKQHDSAVNPSSSAGSSTSAG